MAYPAEMEFLRIRILGLPFLYMFQVGNAFLIASLSSRFLIYGFITQALVNILLDYLFIFGNFGIPAMGFNGAAVASVISEMAGMLAVFYIIRSTGLQKKFGLLKNFSFDKPVSSQILSISAPLVLQYVISIATWLAFFLLIEPKGTTAKAISNTMRNVFGIAGIFVWALAGTTNVMVSNLIGQGKQETVMSLVRRISLWSFVLCLMLISFLNLLPYHFFRMFGQDESFVAEGIPVLRMVSAGLILMSVSNIWLNAVTGTGKTKMNLLIEVLAIAAYIPYTWYMMNVNYISLAMAWSNELFYWAVLFLISYWYMKSGKWKNDLP
jgi:Na+-driven multidrug efflux pump